MKKVLYLTLLLCIIFSACLRQQITFHQSREFIEEEGFLYNRDFLVIHLNSLQFIDYLLAERYRLNTEEDCRQVVSDIKRFHQYAKSKKIANRTVPDELLARAEKHLAVNVFKFIKQQELHPSADEIARYYEEHSEEYAQGDFIRGSRILIEYGDQAEEQVAVWTEKLENSSAPFEDIASEFYRTRGQLYDGSFGLVVRGVIQEDIFNLFYEQVPSAAYFGPVETRNGYLLGKLHDKGEAGHRPLDEVRERIGQTLLQQNLDRYYDTFFEREKGNHQVEIFLDTSEEEAPALDEPVYSFNGYTYTYREILENHPGVFGNASSALFCQALMKRNLEMDLFYASDELEPVKHSPAYLFLRQSFCDRFIVHRYIQQSLDAFQPAEAEIEIFYRENCEQDYSKPAEAKLLIFAIQRNPDQKTHPYQIYLASREAWEFAQQLHADFLRFEAEEYPLRNLEGQKGLRITPVDTFTPIDQSGRLVEMDIPGKQPGYTSSLLISQSTYLFYHIFQMRQPDCFALPEVQDRVIQDMRKAHKQNLLDTLQKDTAKY